MIHINKNKIKDRTTFKEFKEIFKGINPFSIFARMNHIYDEANASQSGLHLFRPCGRI